MLTNNFKFYLSLFLIILISFINIALYQYEIIQADSGSNIIWFCFYVWAWCLVLGTYLGWRQLGPRFKNKIKEIIVSEVKLISFLLALASTFYLVFLSSLDYVLPTDSLREAGYNALPLFQDQIFNPFALGSYAGYGNLVPLIGSWFIRIFGTSALAVRLPTVIIGILTLLFLYLLLRMWQGKTAAIVGVLLLTFSLRYLHYVRSEIVIVSPTLFLVLFLLLIYALQNKNKGWLLLGIMMGLSFHFYVATRAIALLMIAYLFFTRFLQSKTRIKFIFKKIAVLFLGIIIGLGPAISHLTHQATGAGSWLFQQSAFAALDFPGKISFIINQYLGAVANNFYKATAPIHYPVTSPILEFPLNLLTVVAILLMIVNKKFRTYLSSLLLILLFTLPFFLQALSSDITQDQRNLTNLIIGVIFSAVVLQWVANIQLPRKILKKLPALKQLPMVLIFMLMTVNLISTVKAYFFNKVSYRAFMNDQKSFSLQAISEHIYNKKFFYLQHNQKVVVVYNRPELLHVQEKLAYYAFPLTVDLMHFNNYETNIAGIAGQQTVTYFADDYELDLTTAVEHEKICTASFWPDYNCPIDNQNYSFFIK